MIDQSDAIKLAQLSLMLFLYPVRYLGFFEEDFDLCDDSRLAHVRSIRECSQTIRSLLVELPPELNHELSGAIGNGWRIRLCEIFQECLVSLRKDLWEDLEPWEQFEEGDSQRPIDFKTVEIVKNWDELEDFLKRTESSVFAAYILFRNGECDFAEDADVKELPPLDTKNGEWINSPDLADKLGIENNTLITNRSKGLIKGETGGVDERGRPWRKVRNKAWYHLPSLPERDKSKLRMT